MSDCDLISATPAIWSLIGCLEQEQQLQSLPENRAPVKECGAIVSYGDGSSDLTKTPDRTQKVH